MTSSFYDESDLLYSSFVYFLLNVRNVFCNLMLSYGSRFIPVSKTTILKLEIEMELSLSGRFKGVVPVKNVSENKRIYLIGKKKRFVVFSRLCENRVSH